MNNYSRSRKICDTLILTAISSVPLIILALGVMSDRAQEKCLSHKSSNTPCDDWFAKNQKILNLVQFGLMFSVIFTLIFLAKYSNYLTGNFTQTAESREPTEATVARVRNPISSDHATSQSPLLLEMV